MDLVFYFKNVDFVVLFKKYRSYVFVSEICIVRFCLKNMDLVFLFQYLLCAILKTSEKLFLRRIINTNSNIYYKTGRIM